MTKEEAAKFVATTFDDDGPDQDDVEAAFEAIYERPAATSDRKNGLWSMICSASSHCGCSTRSEHEGDACLADPISEATDDCPARKQPRYGSIYSASRLSPPSGSDYTHVLVSDDGVLGWRDKNGSQSEGFTFSIAEL